MNCFDCERWRAKGELTCEPTRREQTSRNISSQVGLDDIMCPVTHIWDTTVDGLYNQPTSWILSVEGTRKQKCQTYVGLEGARGRTQGLHPQGTFGETQDIKDKRRVLEDLRTP